MTAPVRCPTCGAEYVVPIEAEAQAQEADEARHRESARVLISAEEMARMSRELDDRLFDRDPGRRSLCRRQ